LSLWVDKPKQENLTAGDPEEQFTVSATKAQSMYATVYHGLTVEFKLSPIESLAISTIHSLSQKEGYAYAGQKLYSHLLHVTSATINNTLKKLNRKGFLEKLPKKSRYGTTRWKISPQIEDRLKYIKTQIDRGKREKR